LRTFSLDVAFYLKVVFSTVLIPNVYSYSLLVHIKIIEDPALTLEWILQVLLTNIFVKIDCLGHAWVFLVVNNA